MKDSVKKTVSLNLIALAAIVGIMAFSLLDDTLWRPRAPFSEEDRWILEKELDRTVSMTSHLGKWHDKTSFFKKSSGLSVSVELSPSYEKQKAFEELSKTLLKTGWAPYQSDYPEAYISLCKSKYRANFFWLEGTAQISATFSVKRYQSDLNC